jgi:hypothetical protein
MVCSPYNGSTPMIMPENTSDFSPIEISEARVSLLVVKYR